MLFFGSLTLAVVFFALGHASLLVAFINRLHSTATPRPIVKVIDIFWNLWLFGIPILIAAWWMQYITLNAIPDFRDPISQIVAVYLSACCFAAGWAVADRVQRTKEIQTSELLLTNHTTIISLKRPDQPLAGDRLTRLLSRVPLNEIFDLSIHEKTIRIPRLAPALDGLRITHLSDLHLTGQLRQAYYEHLVSYANEWEADLVMITGDIVEKKHCLPWIEATLSQLQARHGVYYVLGNHELRIHDERLIRETLNGAGLIDMGHRWRQIACRGEPIVLLGNELPWFPPAADMATCPSEVNGQPALRILLSHSPDQLAWARKHDCDLMLAGHTHGGQVRLPGIGPVVAPSWQGSRFASGTFYYEPTLMHVSRGISGTRPFRLNCKPELARLILTSASGK